MNWFQKVFAHLVDRTNGKTPAGLQQPGSMGPGGWFPIVREPFTGAWQSNQEIKADTSLSYSAVYACVTLIASDIAKLGLRLVAEDSHGIWTPTEAAAFSPVLRKPNRYQTRIKFVEQWLTSKLIHGNAYVLKQRDARGVVIALYVLDPSRVQVLVAPDGGVYYQLSADNLSSIGAEQVTVPAREIIHDPMVCLFHPLIGVTPIYACGLAALQGLKIQSNQEQFFAVGSRPGGILTAPGEIGDVNAANLKAYFEANFSGANIGRVAVLGNGLKYESMSYNAVDSQLIEQLQWTGATCAACYHVPAYKVGIGDYPHFNNVDALNQDYYSQCLQTLIESFELSLDEGLELPKPYGTEFDLDDLIRMDTATKTKAAGDGVGSGCLSPNDARRRYFNLGPVEGESPYLQVQNYSLKALAKRDADDPFAKPAPAPEPEELDEDEDSEDDETEFVARLAAAVHTKAIAESLYAHVEAIATVVVDTIKRAIGPVLAELSEQSNRINAIGGSEIDLRDRVKALETRAPIPGPAGLPGVDGKDGAGIDDVAIEFDGERTLAFTVTRAGQMKTIPLTLPFLCYQGTYAEGYAYMKGDVVTAGGNAWHCQKPTTLKPGNDVNAWRLMVRKGKDAREARTPDLVK